MLKQNESKPEEYKMSIDQIEQQAREAVKMGHVNEHGNIVKWDSFQQTNK
jgi:hypothetical protein